MTLPQFGRFLAGNRFVEGNAAKLSSAWTGRYEQVLKVPYLRSVVLILAILLKIDQLAGNSSDLSRKDPGDHDKA